MNLACKIGFGVWIACIVTSQAAGARCSRHNYTSFVSRFEAARDTMASKPYDAYTSLSDIDRDLTGCLQSEPNAEVRFKAALLEVGLRAYIGAADATAGNLARGRATALAALQDARRFERDSRSDAGHLRLARDLLNQMQRPLDIIERLR